MWYLECSILIYRTKKLITEHILSSGMKLLNALMMLLLLILITVMMVVIVMVVVVVM